MYSDRVMLFNINEVQVFLLWFAYEKNIIIWMFLKGQFFCFICVYIYNVIINEKFSIIFDQAWIISYSKLIIFMLDVKINKQFDY